VNNLVLTATGLVKGYRSGAARLQILDGVDLQVVAGETVSIRGESGTGKSTLLNLLAGLDTPDAGTLGWGGPDLKLPAERARHLGVVFQSFYLVPELDALANVLLAARIRANITADDRRRAEGLLDRVGLAQRAQHLPAQLSGGERQRVAIARALINRPRLVLADEPTGNLDERTGEAVMDQLLALCADGGVALVLVTHNPAHAARCARRLTLRGGRFVDQA
jgi:lipoprotein-releasing system ATP-binding protein